MSLPRSTQSELEAETRAMTSTRRNHSFAADEIKRSVHGGGRLAAFTIALEAWRRGLSVTFLDARPFEFELSDGDKTVRFDRALPAATTREAFRNCNNKSKALALLEEAGVPVPRGYRVDANESDASDVIRLARDLGYPVVIKPVLGSMGKGVFSGVMSDGDLAEYFRYIVEDLDKKRIILEEHINGEDYRIFVVGANVAAATWRRAASVMGDGRHTIAELIAEKNLQRRSNPALSQERITVDLEVDRYVADQGFTYQSVPGPGHEVRLRGKANLSTGGEIVDVTHQLPNEIKRVAVEAVAAVPGLISAGVDLMVDRRPEELDGNARAAVIELNPRAHIGGHMFPSEGPGHDAAGALVDYFFPETQMIAGSRGGRVSFDIDAILAPMRTGVVEKATVAALPSHGYPDRRRLFFPRSPKLKRAVRDLISRSSRRWTIAGSLQAQPGGIELLVAGDTEGVEAFIALVSETLDVDADDRGSWEGVVWKGFQLSVPTEP